MSIQFIDKYEIVSTLGRGSMGVVYKARDPEIGRVVAIKTLKTVFMGDDPLGNEALQRFRQESRSAGKLHHPNIVTIFEAGRADNGSPFIVMEYIEGKSLEAMIAEHGALEPLAVFHYLSQIASAVDYAHSQNVIHRDIKPSNIIVDARHRPYLLDFGVAKLSDTSLTPAGTVVGTPSYMSPEQIRGVPLDGRSDLFSLAVVAYETFTGQRPFPGNDFTTVVSNIIHREPLTFAEVSCSLPPQLEDVLRQGLSKEREDRYPGALEFIDAAAQACGVIVDANGLAGGYGPGMKMPELSTRANVSRSRAETVLGTFHPGLSSAAGGGAVQAQASMSAGRVEHSSVNANLLSRHHSGGVAVPSKPNGYKQGTQSGVAQGKFDHQQQAVDINATIRGRADEFHQQTENEESETFSGGYGRRIVGILLVVAVIVTGGFFAKPLLKSLLGHPSGLDKGTSVDIESEGPSSTIVSSGNPSTTPTDISDVVTETSVSSLMIKPVKPTRPAQGFSAELIAALSDAEILGLLADDGLEREALRLAISESGKRKNLVFVEYLAKQARNEDYLIRIEVLRALSREPYLKAKQTLEIRALLLNDTEYLVRGFAARSLAASGSAEDLKILEARYKEEKNAVVLKVMKEALGR